MALTPEMVANKRFTPTRLREGYDMGEVDSFLDEIETELTRLGSGRDSNEELEALEAENEELREKLQQVHGAYQVAQQRVANMEDEMTTLREALADAQAAQAEVVTHEMPELAGSFELPPAEEEAEEETSWDDSPTAWDEVEEALEAEEEGVEAPAAPVFANWPPAPVSTTEEASAAARRLLEMAVEVADNVVANANVEADATREEVAKEVHDLKNEAQKEISGAILEAHDEAARVVTEANEHRETVLAGLQEEHARLAGAVEQLEAYENDYRESLAVYFEEQLAGIRGTTVGEALATEYVEDSTDDVVVVEDEVSDEEVSEEMAPVEEVTMEEVPEVADFGAPEGEIKEGFEAGVEVEDFTPEATETIEKATDEEN